VYYRRAPDPGYAPPGVPPDIIAPERPRGALRQRNAAPPIAVAPLEPLFARATASDDARTDDTHTKRAQSPLNGASRRPMQRRRCAAMLDHRGCNDDACVAIHIADLVDGDHIKLAV